MPRPRRLIHTRQPAFDKPVTIEELIAHERQWRQDGDARAAKKMAAEADARRSVTGVTRYVATAASYQNDPGRAALRRGYETSNGL